MSVRILVGDCRDVLATLEPESFDSCVTDPPYEIGFMGKGWDKAGAAFDARTWREVARVLKPGAFLLAFGGTRTFHRLVAAIEDAGFEIRDSIAWLYGSGFPKSLNVSKAIDKAAGAEREVIAQGAPVKRMIPGADQNATGSWIKDNGREFVPTTTAPATDAAREWDGWGTALKPAMELIVVARKPFKGSVAANVRALGTGALNIDGCRVGTDGGCAGAGAGAGARVYGDGLNGTFAQPVPGLGRWPANLIHDGSDEVLAAFPDAPGHGEMNRTSASAARGDSGSAARFFYTAKASAADRGDGNTHPTVKPTDLMQYLVRLVTRRGGRVLDPFGGSGTTALAADREQMDATIIELEEAHAEIARKRVRADAPLFAGIEL